MALRQEFALTHSEFNEFLYAPIGDEGNGMVLSVFSALTRLELDPWGEAARLAELSRENAIQALVPIIARLPGGRWARADSAAIAARLVAFLPIRAAFAPRSVVSGSDRGKLKQPPWFSVLLIALIFFGAFVVFGEMSRSPSPADGSATNGAGSTGERSSHP